MKGEDYLGYALREAVRKTNLELLATQKTHLDARFSGSTMVIVVICGS